MDEGSRWYADCKVCCSSASGPTSWKMEDWADGHTANHPGHTVDVYSEADL